MFKPKAFMKDVDRGWKQVRLTAALIHKTKKKVHVGVLGGSKAKRDGDPIDNVELALIHEFGTRDGHIPERSFIRSTFEAHKAKYVSIVKRLMPEILDQKRTVENVLNILGATMAADIKKRMADGIAPPNAPSTIAAKRAKHYKGAAKGEPKPLIDTGQLLGSITWAIMNGDTDAG